jgi:tRNA dimethylallyltransferase
VEETRRLVEMGYDKRSTAMQAIGYKEILPYLKGECSLEEAVEMLKRNTRRYAKRQMTWFRRMQEIIWLDMDEDTDMKEAAGKIIHHCLATHGIIL